jgi:AcrR family transcriptional regulator
MPKKVDQEARREAIATAVWRLLVRGGLEGVNVREVAREAGVSTGSLAHYFESKDNLLSYALNLAHKRAARRITEAAEREPAAAAVRAAALENLPLDENRRTEYHAWLSFWARAASTPELAADHATRYDGWRRMLEGVIRRGQADGSLRADRDAAQEADLLIAFIDGLGVQALFEPQRLTDETIVALLDAQLERLVPEP